jgi:hypothetical protein
VNWAKAWKAAAKTRVALRDFDQLWAAYQDATKLMFKALDKVSAVEEAHEADLEDLRMLMRHCTAAYEFMSRGRITKPNTLPQAVIDLAKELDEEVLNEAVEEAVEEALADYRGRCTVEYEMRLADERDALRERVKELEEAIGEALYEIETANIDWALLNNHSPDYDPSYKPEYPKEQEILKAALRGKP